ncbi:uncharacterized protein B0I36DRAFT_378185 [Microdochium trichocladiopsis]|uniref:Tyrosinase copper-binding domain-containing protein n=1 Tax=Microdochium trichocladiopsis TaxID=1682393 RepID=A0A9P8XSB3_9PEZI|nr:uncharacterized protein B0I36DRAFT_378185 [Microdochium trichocladiopsis]KAH7014498.1 hypothetical protein B0I36DRAFT_378185 [Microdochium trichocladiopsis]
MKSTIIPVLLAGAASALPTVNITASTCVAPSKRIEWRQLGAANQQSYLNAVKCLKTKPSRLGIEPASTLYDDFPYVHFQLNNYIHGGAPFLPWHRYFTHVYFDALAECGYVGPGTYWDWTLDTDGLRFSPVMAAENGFGGDGSDTRTEPNADPKDKRPFRCVSDGPLANIRPYYVAITPKEMKAGGHCLFRKLPEVSEPEAFKKMMEGSIIEPALSNVQASGNWSTYAWALEGGPHGVIHASLGGEMNPTTSPNEPLFFLHHAQIDHLWWLWQQEDTSKRLTEYNGPAFHFNEEGSREVSLDDVLPMYGLVERELTVREVIDTYGELCYSY